MAPVDFSPLFFPKNIAVIGVSNNPVGGLKYIIAHEISGYKGGLYSINPKYVDEGVGGRKVYASLLSEGVPEIDLCIIAIPAPFVPDAIRQCHQKGVKFAIIFSSGFAEAGNMELDQQLRVAIAEGSTRVVGPNCLGVLNSESRVTYFPKLEFFPGNISIVSQSGGTTARLMAYILSLGLGVRNVVSIGNSVDVTITDLLLYFKDDPKTEVIALYMESIQDGRAFLEALKEVTKTKKVVLWKGGQTEVGGLAAQSHTGGLAGSYNIWKAAMRQAGAIHGEYFEQVVDLIVSCSLNVPLPQSKKIGVVISGGGLCVEFTDTLIHNGLELPELTEETQQKLAKVFPDVNTAFRNPVDLGEYGYIPQYFQQALKAVTDDPNVGTILFVRESERFEMFREILGVEDFAGETYKAIKNVVYSTQKPLIMNSSPNWEELDFIALRHQFRDKMYKLHIPDIQLIPHIARVINELYQYGRYLENVK